jgi:2-methylcitrate dehydratase PrpD
MSSRVPPPYLETISRFLSGATLADLTPQARDRARWIIADCIAVIAAGMQQPEMKAFVAMQLASAGPGNAWVIGAGRRAGALDAALLNGTAGTWLELDEGNLFAKGHPGIQVVPAAIALAQERRASGADLLLAAALGYEASARISRAAQIRLSIHPHGTYGVIGAAIAAARLKGFDAGQMRELVNVAATMGMATSRQTLLDGATVRNIFTGHSGHMGLTAARLVECGFTGEIDGVSNVYGKVLSDHFRPEEVTAGLGTDWLITQNYFKLHPTGRYVHSAIDALEDLLGKVPGARLDVISSGRSGYGPTCSRPCSPKRTWCRASEHVFQCPSLSRASSTMAARDWRVLTKRRSPIRRYRRWPPSSCWKRIRSTRRGIRSSSPAISRSRSPTARRGRAIAP